MLIRKAGSQKEEEENINSRIYWFDFKIFETHYKNVPNVFKGFKALLKQSKCSKSK